MKALVVYCHPRPQSFNFVVKEKVLERLEAAGAEIRVLDLYEQGFDPRLSAQALEFIEDEALNRKGIEDHCAALTWCDTLIFVYPTWWYGLPAMLKGWLDRVLVSGVAFQMPPPEGGNIVPNLTHITRLGVYTTCGASWWLTLIVGAPGRRTLLRGVRFLCAKQCRISFAAHYLMDSSTDAGRKAHLARVGNKLDRLVRG